MTRRAVLAALPGSLVAANLPTKKSRSAVQAGEFFRFLDPVTETPVVRLTNPKTSSLFPAPSNRFVSSKGRFLIFSSDRTGRATPFQLDLRTGVLRQLAETADLMTQSLCLDARARFLYLIDRNVLKEIALANLKTRTLAENVIEFSCGASPSEFVVVRQGRLELLNSGSPAIADEVDCTFPPSLRPGGAGWFFARGGSGEEYEFWYAPLARAGDKPVLLARGRISDPFWSPDGRSLLFLREVQAKVLLSEVHEVLPETGVEQGVASTSQFAAFAPNGDASVFVGASRSKAQPNVVLLVRSVQRELTLCEHRASHPKLVSPVFSPDSRRVYFQSDHEGKSALYSVNVELLVEPTAASL